MADENDRVLIDLDKLIENKRSYPAKFQRRRMLIALGQCGVYIVRDNKIVIYVGSTYLSPRERIKQHIIHKSNFGKYIKENYPLSKKWTVEFIKCKTRSEALLIEKQIQKILYPLINKV